MGSPTSAGRIDADTFVVAAAAVLAWGLALGAEATGHGDAFGHHRLVDGGLPLPTILLLFVASWQVMIAAMMLPSSLGMLRTFGRLSATSANPSAERGAFVLAYGVVWTVFGVAALGGDALVHRAVGASAWLQTHEQVIWGSVLIGAGAFQFTALKDRCLTRCRTPVGFLVERYRPGAVHAFRIGLAHGMTCLGCCWALMLVAFAAATGDLVWMAALTCVMLVERTTSWGRDLVRPVGAALIVLGVLVVTGATWIPALLRPG